MAYYDRLTGLYNRNYFVRLLTEFLRRAKEDNRLVSVLVIDIDDFRKVNDGLGNSWKETNWYSSSALS